MNKHRNVLILVCSGIYVAYDLINGYLKLAGNQGGLNLGYFIEALALLGILLLLKIEIDINRKLCFSLEDARTRASRLSGKFSKYMQQQFDQWQLSCSEQEVAWLIVKGFSFTDIAYVRGVKEKTIRQQATNIYAKTGVGNRSEFAAWFIEDLLQSSDGVNSLHISQPHRLVIKAAG